MGDSDKNVVLEKPHKKIEKKSLIYAAVIGLVVFVIYVLANRILNDICLWMFINIQILSASAFNIYLFFSVSVMLILAILSGSFVKHKTNTPNLTVLTGFISGLLIYIYNAKDAGVGLSMFIWVLITIVTTRYGFSLINFSGRILRKLRQPK